MVEDKSKRRRKMRHSLSEMFNSGIKVVKGCKTYSTNRDSVIGDKIGAIANKGPSVSASFKCEHEKKACKSTPDLSLDNLLSASHALSICQNGRELDLDVYPVQVKEYVKQAIRSGRVDICLKKLNRQIVLKIRDEAEQ